MNQNYHRLLLAVAVLLVTAGGVLFVRNLRSGADGKDLTDRRPVNNPYVSYPLPETQVVDASWPKPVENASGWLYDVFTPPEIYIDQNGQLTNIPWSPKPSRPPFGIYLEAIVRKPYRIQLEGYIEEDLKDDSKSLILFYDEETQKKVRLRPGQDYSAGAFTLLNFEIKRTRDANNNISKTATARVLDRRTDKEMELVHGERLFDKKATVVFRSVEEPNFEVTLSKTPAEFEGPAGRYILKEINFAERSVIVQKDFGEGIESEIQTLNESQKQNTPTPRSVKEVPSSTNKKIKESLDSIFQ